MEGVKQYGLAFAKMGHTVEVLTLDSPEESFLIDFPLKVYAIGPSIGDYRYNSRLVSWLDHHAAEFDAIIINGLWQYHGFGAWRSLRKSKIPYFVFTHGMLDPWFKHTYKLKHFKKWVYWIAAEYRMLRDARSVMFTCDEERIQARKSFWLYKVTESVINYGTKSPPQNCAKFGELFFDKFPELLDKRIMLFLGRIQEKKGCDILLEAFAKVAGIDSKLHLVMAGPDQSGWVEKLQAKAMKLGISDRISWPGMLSGDFKWATFYAAEAFVLPSHQENFGIAVAESLGCGLPVLISDKVNIWAEIVADGAGIANVDTVEGTVATLQRWLTMSDSERRIMAEQAGNTFVKRYTIDAMANSLLMTLKSFLK